jgi:ATP-binding cassette, subfamily B, multidrug efflux pump
MLRRKLSQTAFSRLIPFLMPYRWWFMLIGLFLLLIAFLTTLPPWLFQYAIDVALPSGSESWLLWLGAGILLLSLTEGMLSFFQQVISEWISQKVIFEIRSRLFHHLNQLSFSFFDRARVGDLIARVVSDTDTLKRFIGFGLLKVITNAMILLWILAALFYWNAWMGLMYLVMLPFMIHAMWAFSTRVRPAFRRIRKSTGQLTAFTREQLAGIEIIKLFGNETYTESMFNKENDRILTDTMTTNRISAFWLPYSDALLGFFTGFVLLSGGILVAGGQITAGTFIAFLAYINLLNRPIRQTGFLLNLFQQADAAAERIVELLDHQTTVPDLPGAQPFIQLVHSLKMEQVSFSYHDQTVLQNISFTVNKGETLAIIGPSGAGKTTLVHLLLRFYEPQQGSVLIDDKPIAEYTIESLRQKIGLVMQHPFLFDGTIRENIALGSPDAPLHSVQGAARQAQLHTFIETLPSGYDTPIGERGVRLSGGQAQRLALSRVLMREPEILVLDEPTASVDHLTDQSIMDSVSSLMAEKTLLVIAHRLSTVKNADRILFLEQGRITGLGTHAELMQQHMPYRHFMETSGYSHQEGG